MQRVKGVVTLFFLLVFLGYSQDGYSKPRKSKKKRVRTNSSYNYYPEQEVSEESSSSGSDSLLDEHSITNLKISLGYRGHFFEKYKKKKNKEEDYYEDPTVPSIPTIPPIDEIEDNQDEEIIYDIAPNTKKLTDNALGTDGYSTGGVGLGLGGLEIKNGTEEQASTKSGLDLFHLDLNYNFQNASFFLSRTLEGWGELYASYSTPSVRISTGRIELKASGWMGKIAQELRFQQLTLAKMPTVIRDLVLEVDLFHSLNFQVVYDEESQFVVEWFPKNLSPVVIPLVQVYVDTVTNIVLIGGVAVNLNTFVFKTDLALNIPDEGDVKVLELSMDMSIRTGAGLSLGLYGSYTTLLGGDGADFDVYSISPTIRFWGLSNIFVPYFNFNYFGAKGASSSWNLGIGILGSI